MNQRVALIIRAYDRLEDLYLNVDIINDTWKNFSYDIFAVTNGKSAGHNVDESLSEKVCKLIVLENNAGHLQGDSQMLQAGMDTINFSNYDFIIALQSDTWVYGDDIVKKYTEKMRKSNSVYAAARWYDRIFSIATDFAIIDSHFLSTNKAIFKFMDYPEYVIGKHVFSECMVAKYLMSRNENFLFISENMNAMVPSYLKKFPYAPHGRFYVYPKSKMVTHHVEDLKGGMNEKKFHFNALAGVDYFKISNHSNIKVEYLKMYLVSLIEKILVRRSWYSKRVDLLSIKSKLEIK
jgi:hypothetical protein